MEKYPAIDLKDKQILVTGGAGFLGSAVVKELIKQGVPEGHIYVPRFKEVDLRTEDVCREIVREKDIVIHLAALTGGIGFHAAHPGQMFYDNLVMGVLLMEAARLAGVEKFVSIGSAVEYPADAPLPYREEDLWNGLPDPVHAPFSLAKRMLLVQGQAYRAQYGFNAIHLLPNNMFGPGEKFESGFVIPSIMQKVLEAENTDSAFITAWGTGRAMREFVYVEDAARAVVLATQRYNKSEPVNIGSGEEISVKDLVVMIANLMNFKGEIRWDITKPDGQLRRNLDVSRAEREFGFRATVPFEEGLRKTIAWHQKMK